MQRTKNSCYHLSLPISHKISLGKFVYKLQRFNGRTRRNLRILSEARLGNVFPKKVHIVFHQPTTL